VRVPPVDRGSIIDRRALGPAVDGAVSGSSRRSLGGHAQAQSPPFELRPVEPLEGAAGVLVEAELDEAEPPRPSCLPIGHDHDFRDLPPFVFEYAPEGVLGRGVRDVPNKKTCTHLTSVFLGCPALDHAAPKRWRVSCAGSGGEASPRDLRTSSCLKGSGLSWKIAVLNHELC